MLTFIRHLLSFIVSVSFDLIIFIVIFQFLLELVDRHYHHPIKQYILHYTEPLIQPLHRFLRSYHSVDFSLLLLLFLLENLKLILMFLLAGQFPNLILLLVWSILLIINSFITFYIFFLLFRILISWVLPIYSNHPATQIMYMLTEPLLRPIRRKIRTHRGFDWTPIIVIIALKVLSVLIGYVLFKLGAPSFIR